MRQDAETGHVRTGDPRDMDGAGQSIKDLEVSVASSPIHCSHRQAGTATGAEGRQGCPQLTAELLTCRLLGC